MEMTVEKNQVQLLGILSTGCNRRFRNRRRKRGGGPPSSEALQHYGGRRGVPMKRIRMWLRYGAEDQLGVVSAATRPKVAALAGTAVLNGRPDHVIAGCFQGAPGAPGGAGRSR